MNRATAVLIPGEPVTIPPAGNISFEIEPGQRLKLAQPEGEQVADLISFNRGDCSRVAVDAVKPSRQSVLEADGSACA